MRISCSIINQAIFKITQGLTRSDSHIMNPPSKSVMKYSMEQLIYHFKFYTENIVIPNTMFYQAVEAPKGEFGIFLVGVNSNKPLKCKFKAPGFYIYIVYIHLLNLIS